MFFLANEQPPSKQTSQKKTSTADTVQWPVFGVCPTQSAPLAPRPAATPQTRRTDLRLRLFCWLKQCGAAARSVSSVNVLHNAGKVVNLQRLRIAAHRLFDGVVSEEAFSTHMARNRFGTDILARSGSMNKKAGGMTYMKNGVQRVRVIPVNPNTSGQQETRSVFNFLNKEWASLTNTEREAWVTAKADPYWYVPDGFYGGTRPSGSGKALFIAVNYNLNQTNGTLAAPTVVTTNPPSQEPIDELAVTSVVADESANTLVLTYTGTTGNEEIFVRMTPAVSPGNMRLTSVQSKLRFSPAGAGASPATITKPDGISFDGQTGQKVFYVVEAIGNVSGKKRVIASGDTIVVA